jgi:Rps23 Pro-64 3,4-dihydroxylase Tpa1-like proline 4-hydroxylase
VALRSVSGGQLDLLAAPAFDEQRLMQLARDRAAAYRTADPFPHIVEDDLFEASMLERVIEEFEAMDRGQWHHTEASHERKWSTNDARQMGPFTSALIAQLNGGPFVGFLEALTGINGLVPDPHLRGGGLHEIRPGGLLGVHADFNIHPRLKLYRRLNLLVYLNKDWQESWGGALELWDRGGKACVRAVPPVFNRTVLFDTSNFSYHGHPHPLACPPERARRSVALYYYSLECPAEADRVEHGTLFIN